MVTVSLAGSGGYATGVLLEADCRACASVAPRQSSKRVADSLIGNPPCWPRCAGKMGGVGKKVSGPPATRKKAEDRLFLDFECWLIG